MLRVGPREMTTELRAIRKLPDFKQNSLLPIVAPEDAPAELLAAGTSATVKIDLPNQTLTTPSRKESSFRWASSRSTAWWKAWTKSGTFSSTRARWRRTNRSGSGRSIRWWRSGGSGQGSGAAEDRRAAGRTTVIDLISFRTARDIFC